MVVGTASGNVSLFTLRGYLVGTFHQVGVMFIVDAFYVDNVIQFDVISYAAY